MKEYFLFGQVPLIALVIFSAVLAALMVIKVVLLKQLTRIGESKNLEFLSVPVQLVKATRFSTLAVIALLIAVNQVSLTAVQQKWVSYAWVIALVFQLAVWATRIVTVSVERSFRKQRGSDPSAATHLMMIGLAARIAVWVIASLVVLDNLGFNITTLMASLGIGGIAVALAVQNILGDVFSSVSIALDKPFVIGDFIVVDSYMGTVEYVGLKTTRIRSLTGEQIIFSNAELLKSRIRNYRSMQERRVQFGFSLDYETSPEEVESVPGMVKEIIQSQQIPVRFDRAHFKSYGENSLDFEVVYFVLDPDFNKYMDIQQDINLRLMQGLRSKGIAFAQPTRIVHVFPTESAEEKPQALGRRGQLPGERAAH